MRILIIDDNEEKLHNIMNVVNSYVKKCTIDTATTIYEAKSAILKDIYDLIIVDMCLPMHDGCNLQLYGGIDIILDLFDRNFNSIIIVTSGNTIKINECDYDIRDVVCKLKDEFDEDIIGCINYTHNEIGNFNKVLIDNLFKFGCEFIGDM